MDYTFKNWQNNNIYNFYIEFNRIERYNEYCKEWLSYFGINVDFTSKLNWDIEDIVDIQDYNRVKGNINIILNSIKSTTTRLSISSQYNQVWNVEKANELENKLKEYLAYLGNIQFGNSIVGLAICGNEMKLNGVN